MGTWLYGEYTTQIELIENPDLFLEVTYKVHNYAGKQPWDDKEGQMKYSASLWLRLYSSNVDEVNCNIKEEYLRNEFGKLIEDYYYKIGHLITFKEVME